MRTIVALAALLLAPPLLATDIVALGPEHPFHQPGITAAPAQVGQPIPNEAGYLLLFNAIRWDGSVAFDPLGMMQLDTAGRPIEQWALQTEIDLYPGTIGVRTRSGTYVVNWSNGYGNETLAFLGANGRDILRRVSSFPQYEHFQALDCGVERCVGATLHDGEARLYAFSFDGRQLAGPLLIGEHWGSVAVIADGGVFRLGWTDKDGVHVTALDGTLTRFETAGLASRGSDLTAAWNDRPTYFYDDGNDVYAALPGFAPKRIAHFDDIAYIGTIRAAWNGSEFLVLVNVITKYYYGYE